MTTTALILVLASAAMHATWNFLSKRSLPTGAFFWWANLAGLALLSPMLVRHAELIPRLDPTRWGLVALTGVFLAVYYASLASSYRNDDMSLVYPLARSSPVIVILASTILFGRGGELGAGCIVGSILVVAGCVLVPLDGWRRLKWSSYACPACGLAIVAAFGTAGYSIVDDIALRELRTLDGSTVSALETTLFYAALQAASCALALGVWIAVRREGRRDALRIWREQRRTALATGVAITATYSLVLLAMTSARDVSYVVAFRQASIPIGVALGAILLKEKLYLPRVVGVTTILAGLTLVALD